MLFEIEFTSPKLLDRSSDSRSLWTPANQKSSRSSESSKALSNIGPIARILGENEASLLECFGPIFDVSDSYFRENSLNKVPKHFISLLVCNEVILPLYLSFVWSANYPTNFPKAESFHISMFKQSLGSSWERISSVDELYLSLRSLITFLNAFFGEVGLFQLFFRKIMDVFEDTERVVYLLNPESVTATVSEQLSKFALKLRHPSLMGISRLELIEICSDQIDIDLDLLFRDSQLFQLTSSSTPSITTKKVKKQKVSKPNSQSFPSSSVTVKKAPCLSTLAVELKMSSKLCKFSNRQFEHVVIPSPASKAWKDSVTSSIEKLRTSSFTTRIIDAINNLP